MNKDLRNARMAAGKTQAQIAKEAGISNTAFQLYEYGKREPRAKTAVRIARSVDKTVEDLYG